MNKCFNYPKCHNEAEVEYCGRCLNGGTPLDSTYKYHEPIGDQAERYQRLRDKAKEFALLIDELCPNSREKSLAHTNLEQATMWANAAIARNEAVTRTPWEDAKLEHK